MKTTPARTVASRTHQCPSCHRAQIVDALRSDLAGFEVVVPKGPPKLNVLENAATDPPRALCEKSTNHLEQISTLPG